jgi:hypothetical protein
MHLSLKKLYERCERKSPELFGSFQHLKCYCTDAYSEDNGLPKDVNRSYKSLKWFVYVLREKIAESELEMAFNWLCNEVRDAEMTLYKDITTTDCYANYSKYFNAERVKLSDYVIKEVNGFKLLLNESEKNISNLVFKHRYADIVIFRNENYESAGIIFDERSPSNILDYFNVPAMFVELSERMDEKWTMVGRNLIVCGGSSGLNKTKIKIKQLIKLVEKHKK